VILAGGTVVALFLLFLVADFSGIGLGGWGRSLEFLLDFIKGVARDFVIRLDFDSDWGLGDVVGKEMLGFEFGVFGG